METTCRSVDSLALKPTKEPTVVMDLSMLVYGEGVAVMLAGTWERMTWPLAKKFEPSNVIGDW